MTSADASASTRRGHPLARWLLTAAVFLAGAILVMPAAFGLAGIWGIAQLVALRGPLALGFLLIAVLSVLLPGRRRRIILVLVALLAAGAQVSVLSTRGVFTSDAGTLPIAATRIAGVAEWYGGIVVATWNVKGGKVSDEDLAALFSYYRIDVLALPEAPADVAERFASAADRQGQPMTVLTQRYVPDESGYRSASSSSSSLLVAERLGDYRLVGETLPQTTFSADSATGPALTVAHPTVPFLPGSMADWTEQTADAVQQCRRGTGSIVLGDFNATVDHPALDEASCADAATTLGVSGHGTWPRYLPAALGSTIDHIVYDQDTWRPVYLTIRGDLGDSDHRLVVAALERIG